MKCTECGGVMIVEKNAVRRYDIGGLPHITLHGVEVARCEACGNEDVTIPRIEQLHRVLASGFINQKRALAPTEIRFLRKYIGLSTADFAKVMGKTRETVSRWENGSVPMGDSADRLLRLLVATNAPVDDYEALEVLKQITPEPAPKQLPRCNLRVSSNGWRPSHLITTGGGRPAIAGL